MKNVSSKFIEGIKSGIPIYPAAKVTLANGEILEFTAKKNFRVTGNSITQTAGNNSFPLGAAISKTIKLTVDNSDETLDSKDFLAAIIELKSQMHYADGTTEELKEGTFIVTDPVTPATTLEITAADDISKTAITYKPAIQYPATLRRIYQDVCRQCNLTIGTATFKNDTFTVETAPDGCTCRDLLGYIAMIAGGNAMCDENERVVIKSYDLSSVKKEDGSYNTDAFQVLENFKESPTVSTDPIRVTGVKTTIEGEEGKESELIVGTTEYCFSVSNPLLDGKEKEGLQLISTSAVGLEMYAFSGDHIAYPIAEVMDTCFVKTLKGSIYPTVITSVEYNYLGATKLQCDLDTPERTATSYGGKAAEIYQKFRRVVKRHYTEFEKQMSDLSERIENSSGVFMTKETQPDGSVIYYLHNREKLEESTIVWKMTAEAVAVSTDGGKTWNAGLTVDGDLISKIMTTIGINFDWGVGGTLVIQDANGKETAYMDATTGVVRFNVDSLTIQGQTVESIASGAAEKVAELAKNMTLQLTNEYQAISVDSSGNYSTFPTVTTSPIVMYGTEDITKKCSYSFTCSAGVTGVWDVSTLTYTVKTLTKNEGWVDVRASYLGTLAVTRRFSLAKVYAGADGADGKPGTDGKPGRTYYIEPSALVVKQGNDCSLSPNVLTFHSYYRDGTDVARYDYAGRFKVEESYDGGQTWKTMYTSTANESGIEYSLYTNIVTAAGKAIVTAGKKAISVPRKMSMIRCSFYAASDTTHALDVQTLTVVKDASALGFDELFNILTNNGEIKGIYQKGGQLYISFTYAQGGVLTLGGKNDGHGQLIVLDENGTQIGAWTKNGLILDSVKRFTLGDFLSYDDNRDSVKLTMGGWQVKRTTVEGEPAEYWETSETQENGIGAYGPWVVWGGWNGKGPFNKANYNFVVTEDGSCKAMSWVTGSRSEWKEEICSYEDGALEKVENSKVYRYKLKNRRRENEEHIGFVIGSEYPLSDDLLDYEKDNIDMYSALGVAYKAIQELSAKVKTLEKLIESKQGE